MSECKCSLRIKLVGDGCAVCNPEFYQEMVDVVDEDWLAGVSCNPDAPEECESCQ